MENFLLMTFSLPADHFDGDQPPAKGEITSHKIGSV